MFGSKETNGVSTYHDVHLLPDLCEHALVRDRNSLQYMVCRIQNRCRSSYKVNVREAACVAWSSRPRSSTPPIRTLAEVALDLDGILVHCDSLAWDKGAFVRLHVGLRVGLRHGSHGKYRRGCWVNALCSRKCSRSSCCQLAGYLIRKATASSRALPLSVHGLRNHRRTARP